ncbi:unnamed protein product [Symbiodinium microadriaticum]|nr:unnamed protein product [Symbiodinium microadriaticum]
MQALTAVVGADAVQPVDRPPSSETVTGAPGGTADDDSNSATSIHTDPSRRRVEVLSEAGLPSQADLLMPDILARLHEKYCRHFQRELSKHILVLDLPRIADDSSPAGSPAARTRKNPRNTIGRMPTRGTRAVMGTPLSNWELRFMSDELLTRLFKMDSKSAYINDRKNEYLEELDAASDEEDGKKQSRGASREGGADRAAAPRTVATERFYIQRYDSFADASSTVGVMASLSKPCFMDLGGFATDR